MTRAFNRDAAFEAKLGSDDDAIQEMIVLDDHLYAFSTKRIYQLRTANEIDPARTALDTRHSYQEVYSVGCNNPIVARSIIQANRILKSVALKQGISNPLILNSMWAVTKLLLQCENAYFQIYNDTTAIFPRCNELIEQSKSQSFIPSLPQVADLEVRVSSFLGSAKRCLERAHELLGVFYGCPIGDSNFQSYREWMRANRSESVAVLELLEDDKEWIRFIARARNALDVNHSRQGFVLEVRNIQLDPGNKFSGPNWRHDLSGGGGAVQENWSDIVIDMNVHMRNLVKFVEDLYALCIMDLCHRGVPFDFSVVEIPADQIREECPVRLMTQVLPRQS